MAKVQDPFTIVLWQATDRFFTQSTDLVPDLDKDPAGTLFRLSSTPEQFGTIKPTHTVERRQLLHRQLLTAARAYIVSARKLTTDAVDQGEFVLES